MYVFSLTIFYLKIGCCFSYFWKIKKAEEWLCDLIIFLFVFVIDLYKKINGHFFVILFFFRIKIYFKKFDKHNLEKFIFLFVIL